MVERRQGQVWEWGRGKKELGKRKMGRCRRWWRQRGIGISREMGREKEMAELKGDREGNGNRQGKVCGYREGDGELG